MYTDESSLPTTTRLAPKRLLMAAVIIGAMLTGMVFMSLLNRQRLAEQPPAPPLPPLYEVQGDGDAFQRLQLKTSWAGEDRTPPQPPPPPVLPPPPSLFPAQPPMVASLPLTSVPPPGPAPLPAMTMAPTPTPAPVRTAAVEPLKTPAQPPAQKVRRYLFMKGEGTAHSPFGEEKKAPGGDQDGKNKGSLITDATLEQPAKIERTWYRSQALHGITANVIESQLGGPVIIRVTRPLEDKFLQGETLIPQHALVVAKQEGAPQFGDARLGIAIEQVENPDGSILQLTAKASDQFGAQGLTGTVNNRWSRVFLGAGLSALLSIGTRVPAGNQEGFAPTIAQQTAQDASNGIARAGNDAIRRELDVKPLITIPSGTVVTIYPNANLSLAKPATVIR